MLEMSSGAFLSLKRILRYSKSLNVVITAVFGMSSATIRIWWKALVISRTENIVAFLILAEVSFMFGTKYWSGVVTKFEQWYSLHGYTSFVPILSCRTNGEAYGDFDSLTMPSFTKFWNSYLAWKNFFGGNLRGFESLGGLVWI